MEEIDKIEANIFHLLESRTDVCRFCFVKFNDVRHSILFEDVLERIRFCFPTLKFDEVSSLLNFICSTCNSSLNTTFEFLNSVTFSCHILEKFRFQQHQTQTQDCHENEDSNCGFEAEVDDSPLTVARNLGSKPKRIKRKAHMLDYKISTRDYVCSQCNKRYRSNFELEIHQRVHSGDRPFTCSQCAKKFFDQRNLRRHEKIHIGKRTHQCPDCQRTFLHLFSLRTHQRIHTGEKHYICETCGKSFNTCGELKIHSRTHTKEKPYGCSFCDKAFSSKAALNIHTRVHTGDKRHPCLVCPQKCRTAYDLKVHMRCHNNEKPYRCKYNDCDKRYKSSSQLNVHLRSHSGEKPHQCSVCCKKFAESNTLKRHFFTHQRH